MYFNPNLSQSDLSNFLNDEKKRINSAIAAHKNPAIFLSLSLGLDTLIADALKAHKVANKDILQTEIRLAIISDVMTLSMDCLQNNTSSEKTIEDEVALLSDCVSAVNKYISSTQNNSPVVTDELANLKNRIDAHTANFINEDKKKERWDNIGKAIGAILIVAAIAFVLTMVTIAIPISAGIVIGVMIGTALAGLVSLTAGSLTSIGIENRANQKRESTKAQKGILCGAALFHDKSAREDQVKKLLQHDTKYRFTSPAPTA